MPGRRRILHDVLNDSDNSDFEGEYGDDASSMFELSMDSGRPLIILISFQMVFYGKPYLFAVLDLQVDDYFRKRTSKLLFLFSGYLSD